MASDIRDSFSLSVTSSDWMDEETREDAFNKVQKLLPLVVYPPFVIDPIKLDSYYSSVSS